jgi:PST family polysaccharide transporter
MWPVNQALYPKLTKQIQDNPNRAMKMVRLSLFLLGALGLVFGVAIFVGAPLLVHLVLGARFRGSVPVLRVFALWIPVSALCTVMIFQLLLPHKLDKQFNFVNSTAVLLGLVSAVLLAPEYKAVGIAWSALLSQLYTLVAFFFVAWRAGLNPFARAAHMSAPSPQPAILVPMLTPARGGSADEDR